MRHFEIDCAKLSRKKALSLMEDCEADDNVACFWDETQRLSEINVTDLFLKPTESFKGIMLLSITPECIKDFSGALFERLHKIWLHVPAGREIAAFLFKKAPEFGISTSAETMAYLVRVSQSSIRTCLDVMQAAYDTNSGVLDADFVREILGDGPPDDGPSDDGFRDPF